MVFSWILVLIYLLLGVTGCSFRQVSQGIYEGVQTRNRLLAPPSERLEKQDYSSFDDYDRQRSGVLHRDGGEDGSVH